MNRGASLTFVLPTLALALLGASGAAVAEYRAGDPINDRFSLSLGTFLIGTDTTIQVNGTVSGTRVPGTQFDVERELGFKDTNRFRVDAYWRFFARHKLTAMYFETNRNDSHSIDTELRFRDVVFPINAQIDSNFSTSIFEVAYEYSFWRRDNYEISASAGIHNLKFGLDLDATGLGSAGQTLSQSQSASANGPLPVFGIHGVWRLGSHFYLDGQAQYFKISIDPYDGRLEAYTVSAVWQALTHVGVGVGYNDFTTKVDVTADRFDGSLRWRYKGARLFVVGSF
jgi:hypothetical protein